jgi:amino acid adenylation domain-containing protein
MAPLLDNVEAVYPLSPLQRGLLFHTEFAPGESPYFTQTSYGLEGSLNVDALERAWAAVVNRHTALRTAFVWQNNGEPMQRVAAHARVPFAKHDWKSLPEDEQKTRWAQYVDEDCRRGFDMSVAPLMRLALFHLAETKHKILWSNHHIILDGWSTPIILEEVFAHYAAFCQGRELRLKEAQPYQQYVEWIQQQDQEKAETYWRRTLAGITSPTSLGLARSSSQTTNGADHTSLSERKLSLDLSNKLRSVSREQFLTPSTIAHGAWAILLSRYSGQQSVLFGSVVSGRPHALRDVTRMVGLFINSLPVRIDVDGKKPVNLWLRELQEHQADMREYSYSSLSEIQRWSEIPSPQTLFENLLIFENYPTKTSLQEEIGPAISKQGLGLQVVSVDAFDRPAYPVCIAVGTGRCFSLQAIYDGRRFDRITVERMLGHFENLLTAISRNPKQEIWQLPLLSEDEERQAIVSWNDTQQEFPRTQSVGELFEQQVALRPNAVAVVYGSEQLSYGELNRRANQLAHYLRKQGVGTEVVVGLCMERSLEMLVGLLGILKAGGAYLPLDPDYPQQRLDYMLSDAQVGLVLTQGRLLDQLPVYLGVTIALDEEWEAIAAESEENAVCESNAENLAYVIYTSGSTGQPKGIGVPHRAISRLVLHTDYAQLGPEDRVAQASTVSFDAATFEIWGALLNGARLVLIDKDVALSPGEFQLALREQEINSLFLTTALFNRLAQTCGAAFAGLKHLLFGGELVDPRWVRAVLEQGAPERLLHVYGPTESTTFATWELVTHVSEGANTVPIGRALANTTAYVLDQWLRPVAVGARGEIYIGGDGLARGYVNDAMRTAERFVPHPHSATGGERLYRTGDEARYLEDGSIEFLGRRDQQVKVRGYRIELEEIEAVLASHDGVREAVVTVREESAGLVGYVVGAAGESWLGSEREAGAELRAFLRERLPEYMVPQRWVVLDHLPLNANGKVDRERLPVPSAIVEAEGEEETQRTPVEELVAGIWSEVLKLEAVGRNENFFELGGHSLLATQVISRVREVFGVEVGLRRLFEAPALRDFSRDIETALRLEEGVTAPALERVEAEERGVLSFAQQRLWFLDQLEPGSTSYNVPMAVRLTGEFQVEALERTLSEIVRRHEVLRARFVNVGGEPRQEVLPAAEVKLSVSELSGLAEAEREAAVRAAVSAESGEPFDLAHGPMLRVKLLRLSEEEHVVLLTMHHIVSDGWSMGVLIKEVATLYGAYSEGAASPLPELKVQYSDFAVWQRGWLQGAELERQLGYWREQLGGELPALELPTDHTRPAVPSNRGAQQRFQLSQETTAALKELSRREGVTLFMTLLAAFQSLLHRYSGQDDIVVGSPVAGRNYAETESLIGFFVNTLPLRVKLSGALPFVELLPRVKEVCLGAYAHQDVPFEKLVEELQPRREGSRSPLYQVVLTLQNAPRAALELSGVRLEKVDSGLVTGKYELNFSLSETSAGLSGFLEYHEELYEAETISRLLGDFERLLELVVANPAAAVGRLRFLSAAEEHEVLVKRNETRRDYGPELRLSEWLAQEAKQHWEQVAVVAAGREISYGELQTDAERVAAQLREQGVGEGWRVGLLLEHRYELIVAVLGVLQTGAAYVPLAAGQGALRNQQLLRDSGVQLVLTQAELQPQVGAAVTQLVWSGGEWLLEESSIETAAAKSAAGLAYVMYTSGTTGKAKGVEVTEASLLNYLHWALEQYVRGERLSFGLCTAMSFDLTVTALYLPLLSGGRIVLYEPGAEAVAAVLRENRVEVLKLTPSHLEQLRGEQHEGSRLRRLIVGGEALSAQLARAVVESFGGELELYNEYGPTEATVGCMLQRYELAEECGAGVPIGRAAANTEIYVLDEGLEPVGENVVGEIYIGGAGLARGYWQGAELTAARFVPHPYSARGGERLYRSGDLGRWRRGGKLEYVGRRDEQVKYQGHRVELQELRAALNEHAEVRESIVRLEREGTTGMLVAYYVSRHELAASELRAWLSERVVKETVPSVYVHLKKLPLGLNGKVNYQELPGLSEWRRQREQAGRDEAGDWTAVEELVAGIWSEVLRLGAVGRKESFFELGGHSLLATQVISRVREVFGVEVGLRRLFEEPTLRGFSRSIEAALRAGAGVTVPALQRLGEEERGQWGGRLPLSFAQQRLWFLDQLEPGSAFYNVPAAVRLKGELQVAALARTLSEIVRRHEVLRTRFVMAGGEPRQEVLAAEEVKLTVADLSNLSEEERAAAVPKAIEAESREPFDLAHGPMLRVKLLRLSEQDHVVLLTMHHIVSDGWSMGVLIKEVATLYSAYSQGGESPLRELPVQYGDFAVWQRGWLQGDELERQLAYWREQLQALPVLELPTDRARPAVQSYRGAQLTFRLSPEVSAGLRELSRREGVTQFMTLLAAFQVLLSRYTGQDDIAVGTPIAGRSRIEIEELIGFFVNTLVLRTNLAGNPPVKELLGRVRDVSLGAAAHQDVPFEKLVEELQPERDLSRSPLFQVMFALQNSTKDLHELANLTLSPLEADPGTAKFDLTIFLHLTKDGVLGMLEYNTDLFDVASIERILVHYKTLLQGIVTYPEQRILSLPILPEPELRQLLTEWNDTVTEFPQDACFHQLFEAQAERSLSAIAVETDDEKLTYDELNRRANRLARFLVTKNVGPETVVAVLAPRGIPLLEAMLAIFKAGGAYLPLDPRHPTTRQVQILTQSKAALVLVTDELEPLIVQAVEQLSGAGVRVYSLEQVLEHATENLELRSTPQNLAYVIFTSGSTGMPKGAMIEQRGMVNHLYVKVRELDLSPPDILAQTASQCFDISVWQFLAPLLVGACVRIFSDEVAADPRGLLDALETEAVSVAETVPSMLRAMLSQIHATASVQDSLAALRWMVVTGEALGPEICRVWKESVGDRIRLLNAYGPTECSDDVTHYEVKQTPGEHVVRMPIGRALSNTQLYIVDRQMGLVPTGASGELCVGGVGVGRGYMYDAERTAEHFVPDPFGGGAGARLYRTGDLCRYLRDGEIEFQGRIDDQVKVRGFRIELGEIEAALESHPAVRQAVVTVRDEQQLAGYVVGESGLGNEREMAAELRAFLRERLPEYMMPQRWVALDQLPLTANGKIDRQRLPAPSGTGAVFADEERRQTQVEELVAAIWSEVLKLEAVARDENFFELGGHSLLATQVISRVREVFGVEVELRRLFAEPTVRGLSRNIEEQLRAGAGVTVPALRQLNAAEREQWGGELPLSFAQQRLWFLDQWEPGSAFYNMPAAVRLKGELRVGALERTLSEIVRRHEVLRTRFVSVSGEPRQEVMPAADVTLAATDLGSLSETEREAAVREAAIAESRDPFDLAMGPMLRVKLLRLGEEEHVVLLTMHHIVSDGWSMGVLIKEVATLYEAYSQDAESPLTEPPIQYSDFAVWQRGWLQGEELERQLEYWRKQLGGELPVLELPADRARPAAPSYRGAQLSFRLSPEVSAGLKELSRREGVTLFMTLLAAFQTLLFRYTGQERIIVGSPIANRNFIQTEGLIGVFINQLVFPCEPGRNPLFSDFLKNVKQVCLGAYAHQDLPFEKLIEELQPVRDTSRPPLVQVEFGIQNAPTPPMKLSNLKLEALNLANETSRYDLTLWMSEWTGALTGWWTYNTDIFDQSTIVKMENHFSVLLESIVRNPATRLTNLEMLTEEEKADIRLKSTHTEESALRKLSAARGKRISVI